MSRTWRMIYLSYSSAGRWAIRRLDIPLLAFVLVVMKNYRCIYSSWFKHESYLVHDLVEFLPGRALDNQRIGHTSSDISDKLIINDHLYFLTNIEVYSNIGITT